MARFFRLCALAVLTLVPSLVGAAEVHLGDADASPIDINVPPQRTRPVLFVHGHAIDFELGSDNTTDDPADPNYKKNWWNGLDGLPSFKQTLDDPINSGLDIEPYYIRFEDRRRSITDDAFDIRQVVDYIVRRHNENFDPRRPTDAAAGSGRHHRLQQGHDQHPAISQEPAAQVQDNAPAAFPCRRRGPATGRSRSSSPSRRPTTAFRRPLFRRPDQISVQQLYNGVRPETDGCGDPFPTSCRKRPISSRS